tara:strand:- start:104 stop:787 length:684 start_codon:yes stop_codon:yes gene_type:complete
MKRCCKCKETKFFDMFCKDKSKKDGYGSRCKSCYKAYCEANKEKIAEQRKVYKEANKDRIAEQRKVYIEANKDRIEAYYEANKEKISERMSAYYEANKDRIDERNKAYKEANKEKTNERGSRYRAMKHNAIPKFLRNCEVEKKRLQDTYKLSQLFSKATGIEHHVDHMWPLSKGGPHWSGNLQILTATENISKSDKLCKELKKNIKASLEISRKEYNNEDHSNGHRD